MILGKYLKNLLNERKQVVLPGFGNLEVKETGGSVPSSGNIIDPPGTRVQFDTGYSKDDGLLASTYSAGEGLEKEEAGQRVLEFVDSIKFALDKGVPYSIPETGTFTRDDNGKVHFKVDPQWVLEADQYGLESMDLLELEDAPMEEEKGVETEKGAETEKASEKTTEVPGEATPTAATQTQEATSISPSGTSPSRTSPSKTPPSKTPQPKTPVAPASRPLTKLAEPIAQKKRSQRVNRWRLIWVVAGVLILVLIALIFIPVDSIKKPGKKDPVTTGTEETGTQGTDGSDIINETPGTANGDQQNGENQVSEETPSETGTPPGEDLPVATDNKFFIIAGSFKHLTNASDLQDQLKARSYTAEVMVTENRMYRVSVASYATKDEAERALAGIKAVPGLESCWLLSN